MAELKIRVDLLVEPALAKAVLVLALLAGLAAESATENVSLSNFYPAPSGVYTKVLSEQSTYLSRDGGNTIIGPVPMGTRDANLIVMGSMGVGLNVTNPPQGVALEIGGGSLRMDNSVMIIEATGGDFTFQNSIGGPNNTAAKYMHFHESGGPVDYVDLSPGNMIGPVVDASGQLGIQTVSPAATLDVSGPDSQIILRQASTTCRTVSVPVATITSCNSGEFATVIPGLLTNLMIAFGTNPPPSPAGLMYCCPCPSGGCPNMP